MLAGNLEIFPDAEESRGVRYGPKKHSLAGAARQRVDWREGRLVGVAADDIGDALAVSTLLHGRTRVSRDGSRRFFSMAPVIDRHGCS